MIPDHYATLGLSPSSEDVVIRAAYRALMRRYHPDGNSTAAAAARTRAINAAYAVLSDPDRRAEYDQSRAAEAWVDISARPLTGLPSRLFAASAILLVLVLVLLVVWSPLPKLERPDRLGHAPGPKVAAADPPLLPEVARFADQPTAADEPAPKVQLNRPPASATPPATPSPRLTAPVKVPPPAPRVRPAPQPQLAAARPAPPKPAPAKPAPAPVAAAEAKPSFNCSLASTRGEIAVCKSANLAALDRQQALLYNQSLGRADAAKRAQLLGTRERFVARRDGCKTDACTSAAYLARMREVSEIMIGASPAAH